MSRPPDWRRRLAAYIEAASGRPFSWAERDCCRWVADAVHRCLGQPDPMGTLRLTYVDQAGAERLIKRGGGLERLVAEICAAQGWREIEPRTARSGDVGYVRHGGHLGADSVALAWGWAWHAVGPNGVATVPLAAGARAWAVPR